MEEGFAGDSKVGFPTGCTHCVPSYEEAGSLQVEFVRNPKPAAEPFDVTKYVKRRCSHNQVHKPRSRLRTVLGETIVTNLQRKERGPDPFAEMDAHRFEIANTSFRKYEEEIKAKIDELATNGFLGLPLTPAEKEENETEIQAELVKVATEALKDTGETSGV